jgi:hypothetical protein
VFWRVTLPPLQGELKGTWEGCIDIRGGRVCEVQLEMGKVSNISNRKGANW